MAPKKKKKQYTPKSGSSTSPNTTLVIFLVLFILVSIVTGVLAYYGYEGQEALKAEATKAKAAEAVAEKARKYFEGLANEARASVGGPLKKDEGNDEQNFWDIWRTDFLSGKYNNEPNYPEVKKWVDKNSQMLAYNQNSKSFGTTYVDIIADLQKKLQQTRTELDTARADKMQAEELARSYQTKYETKINDTITEIRQAQQKELTASLANTDKFVQVEKLNGELNQKIVDLNQSHAVEVRKLNRLNNELLARIEELDGKKANPGSGTIIGAKADPHALMLDISKGRTLWDRPKGNIVRVNPSARTVIIDVGSEDNVKPMLTFNVFGKGVNGEAAGMLKGTIEVINVIDRNTSEARITSLYDSDGNPIALYDRLKGATAREAENPLKVGDELYNMFWNSRIAFAGRMNLAAKDTYTSVEDMRVIAKMLGVLESHGIIVDSYLDLRDGKVYGDMTKDTRVLVLGENMPDEKTRIETDPKVANSKVINAAIADMKKKAVENGLFVISVRNFANMVGYRPPVSAGSAEVPAFRPTLPSGTLLGQEGQRLAPLPDVNLPKR